MNAWDPQDICCVHAGVRKCRICYVYVCSCEGGHAKPLERVLHGPFSDLVCPALPGEGFWLVHPLHSAAVLPSWPCEHAHPAGPLDVPCWTCEHKCISPALWRSVPGLLLSNLLGLCLAGHILLWLCAAVWKTASSATRTPASITTHDGGPHLPSISEQYELVTEGTRCFHTLHTQSHSCARAHTRAHAHTHTCTCACTHIALAQHPHVLAHPRNRTHDSRMRALHVSLSLSTGPQALRIHTYTHIHTHSLPTFLYHSRRSTSLLPLNSDTVHLRSPPNSTSPLLPAPRANPSAALLLGPAAAAGAGAAAAALVLASPAVPATAEGPALGVAPVAAGGVGRPWPSRATCVSTSCTHADRSIGKAVRAAVQTA